MTDPEFAARLHDYLDNEGTPTIETILLLKVGRHFRVGSTRVVVGRNEKKNNILEGFVGYGGTRIKVESYNGPVTLVVGDSDEAIRKAAELTVRYSDAPRSESVWVGVRSSDRETRIKAEAFYESELDTLRICARKKE